MGFFIRKSFRAGPIRLNVSKRGLGTSIGVKGMRVGVSPGRGSYVAGGRGGLYYRKNLGSSSKNLTGRRRSSQSSSGLSFLILALALVVLGALLIDTFVKNPLALVAFGTIISATCIFIFFAKRLKQKSFESYKGAIDSSFILVDHPPSTERLSEIKELRSKAARYADQLQKLEALDKEVYGALLDKIFDDKMISENERDAITKFESIASIDEDYKLNSKREIFRLYYLDAIADHEITIEEINTMKNILLGLNMSKSTVQEELHVVKEILRAQNLCLPLNPVSDVPVRLQKTETAYYLGSGKVLSKRKASMKSDPDYEYTVKRDGTFVITDKRVLVVSDGTTNVNVKDILDVDVDLDNSTIVISKGTVSAPTIIETKEPLYTAKIIDLLTGQVHQ